MENIKTIFELLSLLVSFGAICASIYTILKPNKYY